MWENNARLLIKKGDQHKREGAAAGREIATKGKEWQQGGRSVLDSREKEKLRDSEKYCMYHLIFSFFFFFYYHTSGQGGLEFGIFEIWIQNSSPTQGRNQFLILTFS